MVPLLITISLVFDLNVFSYMNIIAQKYMKRCPREMEQVQCISIPKNICTHMNAIFRGSNPKQGCICTLHFLSVIAFIALSNFFKCHVPSHAFDVTSLHLKTTFLDINLPSYIHDLLKMSLFLITHYLP